MIHKFVRHALLAGTAVTVLAGWQDAALAQSTQAESNGVEEIIVTARRQAESMQTTPVAVTALGVEAIKNLQVADATAIQRTAPSVAMATGSPGGSGFVFISIRGSGNLSAGVANDPSVAVYVDGTYIPRPSQGIANLYDVARVEVLRGPQGTLFGRNTTGGALNIINQQPTGEFEGEFQLKAGNYDERDASAVVNIPLADEQLATRFVYGYSSHDGYVTNVTNNRDNNDRHSHYLRGTIRFAPDDSDWRVTLTGDYNKLTDNGLAVVLTGVLPTANPLIGIGDAITPGGLGQYLHNEARWYQTYGIPFSNNYYASGEFRGSNESYNEVEAYGGTMTVEGRFGGIDLKSISAYRFSNAHGGTDLDGMPLQILAAESFYKSSQLSQEVQLSGGLSDRLQYIMGGFFGRETGMEGSLSQIFGSFDFAAPPPNYGYLINLADVKNISAGIFGQAYFSLSDSVRLTGGLRWTWDKRDVVLHNLTDVAMQTCSPEIVDLPGFQSPCGYPRSASFNYPAWTVGIDAQLSNSVFVYAKTSGAAKAGGFNLRNGSASTPPFDPEKVKDVEIGAKITGLDDRVRLNTALFYSWQGGVQRSATSIVNIGDTPTTTAYLLNAGDQVVYGAEFELTVVPWQGMTLGANLALLRGRYVKGSFTEFRDIPVADLSGCDPVPGDPTKSRCVVDRSDETIPQLPRTQFNVNATQKVPTSLGEFTFFVNYSYLGAQTFDSATVDPRQPAIDQTNLLAQIQLDKIEGYGLLDGRIALALDNPNVELFVYGKNITGKKYLTHTFGGLYTALGVATAYIGDPATYGAGVNFRF